MYVYMCIHVHMCAYMCIRVYIYIKHYFPDPISKRLKRERLESEEGRQERQQSRQEVT